MPASDAKIDLPGAEWTDKELFELFGSPQPPFGPRTLRSASHSSRSLSTSTNGAMKLSGGGWINAGGTNSAGLPALSALPWTISIARSRRIPHSSSSPSESTEVEAALGRGGWPRVELSGVAVLVSGRL